MPLCLYVQHLGILKKKYKHAFIAVRKQQQNEQRTTDEQNSKKVCVCSQPNYVETVN